VRSLIVVMKLMFLNVLDMIKMPIEGESYVLLTTSIDSLQESRDSKSIELSKED
jgi:hypothetical protein